jgi:hypothetical protein
VAVNHTGEEVAALLTHPTDKIVTDCTHADFETDLSATSVPTQLLPEPPRIH